jgi:hypothetical protein
METVLLETPETYNNELYDDEWEIFEDWIDMEREPYAPVIATDVNWEHLYTFQLFVREARKDE